MSSAAVAAAPARCAYFEAHAFKPAQCRHCGSTREAHAQQAAAEAAAKAASDAAAKSQRLLSDAHLPRTACSVRHCDERGRPLPPWIVHVFQGKPAHQEQEEERKAEAPAAAATAAIPAAASASASAPPPISSSRAAPSSSAASAAVPAPPSLPFAPPTTKADHDEHDLTGLSPDQSAFYANEYGKVEQAAEISVALRSLRTLAEGGGTPVVQEVVVHQVSLRSLPALISSLTTQQKALNAVRASDPTTPSIVVLNLCDGTEDDGYPGPSVAGALEATWGVPLSPGSPAPLYFTGASSAFFETTTSKVDMKRCFARAPGGEGRGVRSAGFVDLSSIDTTVPVTAESTTEGGAHRNLFLSLTPSPDTLEYPLIVKPTTSYSSCGLSLASVVESPLEALKQASLIRKELGGVLAEEFVQGREFSMLVVGDWNGYRDNGAGAMLPAADAPPSYSHLRCYTACERAFAGDLPPLQRFLTFEQNYPTKHTRVQTWWQKLDLSDPERQAEQTAMAALACKAYTACRGRSYGRIDIRQSARTGEFFILEVNSLPGLSGELDSSVGAILSHTQPATSFSQFLYAILHLAVTRGKLDSAIGFEEQA